MHWQSRILAVQEELSQLDIDGWLLFDFHSSNPLALRFLGLEQHPLTRRFIYWIPAKGEPVKIIHQIEEEHVVFLPGQTRSYLSWKSFDDLLKTLLKGGKRVAMEYSPMSALPSVSCVDGGILDLVRAKGGEVVSSANLLARFTSVLTDVQIESHKHVCTILSATLDKVWEHIGSSVRKGDPLTEYALQQFILSEFASHNCITTASPIVAVNENSALPHYTASSKESSVIGQSDLILIDLGCKENRPGGIYADMTRMAVCSPEPTPKQQEIFDVVKDAEEAVFHLIHKRMKSGKGIEGYECDDAARKVIRKAGYEEFFPHRTGHSIDQEMHGSGAHLDHFETKDERPLLKRTICSIEPSIYLPGEFGMRIESNLLLHPDGHPEFTTGRQNNLVCLL